VTGTAYTWEILIANHLDQSLWSTNQKYWAAVRSNLLHSFLEVHNHVAPFTNHGKLQEFSAEKPIFWAELAHFDVFTINFIVSSQTLSNHCDALNIFRAISLVFDMWHLTLKLNTVPPCSFHTNINYFRGTMKKIKILRGEVQNVKQTKLINFTV